MKHMKKSLPALVLAVMLLCGMLPASAEELPYDTYNYDYWSDIFRTPAAYVPEGSVLGTQLTWQGQPLGAFVEPQDLCVAPDGTIYLADTNNHRIVVLDASMTTVLNVIKGFDNAGSADAFNKPTGVAVSEDGDIYIADSQNHRVVILHADGTLKAIIEIPAAASSQTLGKSTYTVGTYIDGLDEMAQAVTADSGDTYVVVNLTAEGAQSVTDADGNVYTLAVDSACLRPFQTSYTAADGATLTLADDASSVTYTDADGRQTVIATYDPVPNKDIFTYIGRLVKKLQGSAVSMSKVSTLNAKGVWIDDDGDLYICGAKSITRLSPEGKLIRSYASYKNAAGTQVSLTAISEFAVDGSMLYIRDDANQIIILEEDGKLAEIRRSNVIRVTDAEGNETAQLDVSANRGQDNYGANAIGLVGDALISGLGDTVTVMRRDGEFIQTVENDAVLRLNADGEIVEIITSVQNGKNTERFNGVTGVALLDGKLCVQEADNRVLVLEDGKVIQVAQNNAVKVTDGTGNVTHIITGYTQEGEFHAFAAVNGVEGVALGYVCDDSKPAAQRVQRQISIADSLDQLITLNTADEVIRISANPDSEVLEDGYVFTPLKVSVDYAGRVYCVAQNMFEGIMVFETNGEFTGFFGTIPVNLTAWEKFWRKLATKEERAQQQLFIPTEFTGIDIDEEGFVYASNVDSTGTQAVRRLNPKGEDVIRLGWSENLGGDLWVNGTSQYAGASKITDVVYREKGMYSLLDSKRGRIFTYDHEGNLLYIFGSIGTQAGTMTNPVAIEYAGDRILTLDSKQASIIIYQETEYGRLINEAVGLRYDGDETQAVALWEKVLRMDENNELANIGIGKAYLSAGDNKKAMEYLKRGMSQDYYSVAFKRYRNEVLKENIQGILTGVVVLIVVLWAFFKFVKPRISKKERRV